MPTIHHETEHLQVVEDVNSMGHGPYWIFKKKGGKAVDQLYFDLDSAIRRAAREEEMMEKERAKKRGISVKQAGLF